MKYEINYYGSLIIRNDFGKEIFVTNKLNYWGKRDYDQNGKQIYYEDSSGSVVNL